MELLEKLLRNKTVKKFFGRIPDDHVTETDFQTKIIQPHKSYFEVRLAEMYLRDKREYWREFLPFAINVCTFDYNHKKQVLPFFVGNQLLKDLEKYIQQEYLEILNTAVVGPTPYVGGGFTLFVGLFRTQVNDLAKNLFSCLETIGSAFDATKLLAYVEVAKPLCDWLPQLLNMKEVECRFGVQASFTDTQKDAFLFQNGYFAYINCPEDDPLLKNLRIKEGRLWIGDASDLQPFRTHDFCLMRLNQLDERNDLDTFPFSSIWTDISGNLAADKLPAAEAKFFELLQQLATSPDLTREHRYHLIQVFKANYEHEAALFKDIRGGTPIVREVTRSDSVLRSAEASLQRTVDRVEKDNKPPGVVKGLYALVKKLPEISQPLTNRPRGGPLTSSMINEQVRIVKTASKIAKPDPQDLVDAIISEMLTKT